MIDLILGAFCEVRSEAHAIERGETVASDSRWHVLNGELPTCGAGDDSPAASSSGYDSDEPGKKSRYCRKKWFC